MFVYARAGPTNFGPTAEAATPWVQLAMYTAMRAGPLSVVLVCGQRLWRLPPQLLSCTHCLIWPWDTEAVRAHVRLCILMLPHTQAAAHTLCKAISEHPSTLSVRGLHGVWHELLQLPAAGGRKA